MADVIEIDNTTNPPTIIERDFNEVELAQRQQDLLNKEKLEKAIQDKAAAKSEAEAKLAALGLTADDLKALGLGGN
jgi:hypothetical protein